MESFTTLLASHPALIAGGTVALAITMLTGMLGSLAFKATQSASKAD